MEKFQFIIKSIGISVGVAFICGILYGLIHSYFKPAHPHQILPTWLLFAILFSIGGFAFSLITSILMSLINELKILYAAIISNILTIGAVIFFMSINK